MSTKSKRSSGTQHNSRGITQGTTLVGSPSGLPIDEVVDGAGIRRLAVDANITAQNITVAVALDGVDPNGDSVHLVDATSGNKMKVNLDGSLDVNTEVDAADGDNIAIADFSTGAKLKVNADGSINVNGSIISTPVIANIAIPTANIEQSYILPASTKKFRLKARGNAITKLAFTSGQSGTNFITIFPGSVFEETGLNSTITLYFQLSKSSEILEVLSWS